jgi:hypothetical protein
MKGSIKDLLQIPGVHGYITVQGKTMQIKLPSKHTFSGAKDRIWLLYKDLMEHQSRPGNTVEIVLEDLLLTIFITGNTMLIALSSLRANQALLRMTGKLIIANMQKENG